MLTRRNICACHWFRRNSITHSFRTFFPSILYLNHTLSWVEMPIFHFDLVSTNWIFATSIEFFLKSMQALVLGFYSVDENNAVKNRSPIGHIDSNLTFCCILWMNWRWLTKDDLFCQNYLHSLWTLLKVECIKLLSLSLLIEIFIIPF